ncbi:hypothetical protein OOK31_16445 [Streptomyces sp. NBC_00249]|uniref:hypothetical protein n=1 Tax=Streptomyces sp. NBC_00249 TaxID=2975690 RepID=UPI00225B9FBE|nr:hypothetical protein [Streptomyces sp. NBC_00249]MCX5195474.1 hypothetical protein [Streptomyces sp. NBC_00249]
MSSTSSSDAPIYAQLIRERGDVPGQVRRDAEEILHALAQVMAGRPPTGMPGWRPTSR